MSLQTADYATHNPQSSGGLFIKLAAKGDQIRIRLLTKAAGPISEVYVDPKTDEKTERSGYWWLVMDNTLAAKNKAPSESQIGIFKGGVLIFKAIKELAMDADWGDPLLYDIKITRTEEKAKFYSVVAVPKAPVGPIGEAKLAEFLLSHESTIENILTNLYNKVKGIAAVAPTGGATVAEESMDEKYDPFSDE